LGLNFKCVSVVHHIVSICSLILKHLQFYSVLSQQTFSFITQVLLWILIIVVKHSKLNEIIWKNLKYGVIY